jgi:glycosyltransferase involved in cell wall biosynthesis
MRYGQETGSGGAQVPDERPRVVECHERAAMRVPMVSIGLPTFDRPDLLASVLDNLRGQTFEDFELIISDNASNDPRVRGLCERTALLDSRIRYIRQSENRGAAANFWFVYEQARAPFFMWAADDDLWPKAFIARGIAALNSNPRSDAWFCQVENINSSGQVIRAYPSFSRFTSTRVRSVDLVKFLWEPEVMGKANLIYSLYRRHTLASVVKDFKSMEPTWGLDMALVYAYLCRHRIVVEDDIVLKKRMHTDMQAHDPGPFPRRHIYPWEEARSYFRSYVAAARSTRYVALTAATLRARWKFDVWYHRVMWNKLCQRLFR